MGNNETYSKITSLQTNANVFLSFFVVVLSGRI